MDPALGDSYYIIDPYLDVVNSIQRPFQEDNIEDGNWSFLLYLLGNPDVVFKIITRICLTGIIEMGDDPPFNVPISQRINGANVQVCKYIDTKYAGFSMHDRYILKENGDTISGLHLGCSLNDITDKDICITTFSLQGTELAIKYFKDVWFECVKQKGWKKG